MQKKIRGTIFGLVATIAILDSLSPLRVWAQYGDVFSSQGAPANSRRTGTQGIEGNPNCPPPVIGGITPKNWSCKTSTQARSQPGDVFSSGEEPGGEPLPQRAPRRPSRPWWDRALFPDAGAQESRQGQPEPGGVQGWKQALIGDLIFRAQKKDKAKPSPNRSPISVRISLGPSGVQWVPVQGNNPYYYRFITDAVKEIVGRGKTQTGVDNSGVDREVL